MKKYLKIKKIQIQKNSKIKIKKASKKNNKLENYLF